MDELTLKGYTTVETRAAFSAGLHVLMAPSMLVQRRMPHRSGRRRVARALPHSVVRAAQLAAPLFSAGLLSAALLGACTLSQSDFEPIEVTGPLETEPDLEGQDHEPEKPAAGCRDGADCPMDAECVAEACVPSACTAAEDVSGCVVQLCQEGACSVLTCSDGELGPAESDVDCGGVCAPCSDGKNCSRGADCAGGSCVGGECRAAACDDGVSNGAETGLDCGGPDCPRCGADQACGSDADCADPLGCAPEARVCIPASCQDGDLNGGEVGLDCGGGCPGCPAGTPCALGADCQSGVCAAGLCAQPSCGDGARNQDETGVDCGGSCPAACAVGDACVLATDCESQVCGGAGCAPGVALCCQAPACGDGVQNGTESALDCGNAACGGCPVGRPCTEGAQCQTGFCGAAGVCAVPLVCGDGALNGNEGDVDCGGTEAGCPRCGDGDRCRVNADCSSNRCAASLCVSCSDGFQNGDEGGVDCGGTQPGCPACPRCNVDNSADMGAVGALTQQASNGCAKIAQLPTYPPSLIQSNDVGSFPIPYSYVQECSGQRGAGSFDRPYHQLTMPGLSAACPIVFEFSGPAGSFGINWW